MEPLDVSQISDLSEAELYSQGFDDGKNNKPFAIKNLPSTSGQSKQTYQKYFIYIRAYLNGQIEFLQNNLDLLLSYVDFESSIFRDGEEHVRTSTPPSDEKKHNPVFMAGYYNQKIIFVQSQLSQIESMADYLEIDFSTLDTSTPPQLDPSVQGAIAACTNRTPTESELTDDNFVLGYNDFIMMSSKKMPMLPSPTTGQITCSPLPDDDRSSH